jgi:type III secretion protein V
VQFLLLGLMVGGAGLVLFRQARTNRTGQNTSVPAMQGDGVVTAPPLLIEDGMPALTTALLIRISNATSQVMDSERFSAALEELRENLRERLGLPFPGVRMVRDMSLDPGAYRILVHDVLAAEGSMPAEKRAVRVKGDAALPANLALDPKRAGLGRVGWIAVADALPPNCEEVSTDALLGHHLSEVIFARPDEFLGIQEVQRLLQRAESDLSDLIKEVMKVVPLQRVTDVLRRLLQENVPIRNLRSICECLVNWGAKEKDIVMLTELVRVELGRWIAWRHAPETGTIRAVLIHPDTEANFKRAIQQNASGSFLALTPEERKRFCAEVEKFLQSGQPGAPRPVIVTTMDLRRYARKLVEAALPDLSVLSYEEIGAHASLVVCGTVTL